MSRTTIWTIQAMRVFFLVLSFAAATGVAIYLYRAIANPDKVPEVMTLNVRQPQPVLRWSQQMKQAEQQVGASQSAAPAAKAQLITRATISMFVYRESNPLKRLIVRLTSVSEALPIMVAMLVLAVLVFRILGDIKPGVPFTAANVQRIRAIGILLIGCDVYNWLSGWLLTQYLAGIAPTGTTLTPGVSFTSSLVANWLVGVMLLIIAAGYQRGVELTEEVELTV